MPRSLPGSIRAPPSPAPTVGALAAGHVWIQSAAISDAGHTANTAVHGLINGSYRSSTAIVSALARLLC